VRNPQLDEAHILNYLGQRFDPNADYTANTKHLIADLIHYRGPVGALRTVNSARKLVLKRIHNHIPRPERYDPHQEWAYFRWLKALKHSLSQAIAEHLQRPQTGIGCLP